MLLFILLSKIHCNLNEVTTAQPLKIYDAIYGFEVGKINQYGMPVKYANGKEIGAGYDRDLCTGRGILKSANGHSDATPPTRRVYVKGLTIKCGDSRVRREINLHLELPVRKKRKTVAFGDDEVLEFVNERDVGATIVPERKRKERPNSYDEFERQ